MAFFFASLITFSEPGLAQTYPARPITIVVPFGAGGAADSMARALGVELNADLKQPVLVDNRPGASQVVAGAFVARAEPNGYTLMLQLLPNLIPPALEKTLPYGGNTGFAPVAPVLSLPGVLVISNKVPATSVKEFIALLKASPGKYTYGSPGVGSPIHAWCELINQQVGTKSVHVPYKTYPDMVAQIVNGEVDYSFVSLDFMHFATSGRLKAIGISGAARHPDFPTVPTIDEQGFNGFNLTVSYFVVAPKGTPQDIIQRLNSAITAIASRDSFMNKVRVLGGIQPVSPLSPVQTGELIVSQDERFGNLVKDKRINFE